MPGHLYFICPTDHLEPVISNRSRQESYYFTSLGNSVAFDVDVICELSELLETKNITEITFVLSNDNRIVLDALERNDFSDVTGLSGFYDQIKRQKEYSEEVWQTYNREFMILSYHLNDRIKELRLGLECLPMVPPKIDGNIYVRHKGAFCDIYSDLIFRDYVSVN